MDHKRRIPHEGVRNTDDGLEELRVDDRSDDTEGHGRVTPDELTVTPGTGGDYAPRRPSTGGEFIDENDVEGHSLDAPDGLTLNPGTGGDFAPRRPSTGGEFIDENDVEGH